MPSPDPETASWDAHAIAELPPESDRFGFALVVDGQGTGILEAQRFCIDPKNVLSQAERYLLARIAAEANGNPRLALS